MIMLVLNTADNLDVIFLIARKGMKYIEEIRW